MHKSVFVTLFLLIIYCVSAFFLPSYVQESTIREPKTELINVLETKIENADQETLRALVKMMLVDLKAEKPELNIVQSKTIEMYSSFDSILIGLLILHIASLYGYMRTQRKV